MSQLKKLVLNWCCDWCGPTWPASSDGKPKQRKGCGHRNWDHPTGIFKKAEITSTWKPQLAAVQSVGEAMMHQKW